MRTALITVGDKQQVVLQPENQREHRILQMMTEGNKDIQVMDSELEVTEHGSLVPFKKGQFYDPNRENAEPVMVQVTPEASPERDDTVLVMRSVELLHALRAMHAKRQGLSTTDITDANVISRAHADNEEVLTMILALRMERGQDEPNPYL